MSLWNPAAASLFHSGNARWKGLWSASGKTHRQIWRCTRSAVFSTRFRYFVRTSSAFAVGLDYYVTPIGEVLRAALPPGIKGKDLERLRHSPPNLGGEFVPLALTSDQTKALSTIKGTSGFHPVLLHGITGSGKTEVYMQAVEHFLQAGKTSLISLHVDFSL